MKLKRKLSQVVSDCLRAWNDQKLGDLAAVMIAEDYFTDQELEELESHEDFKQIWLFIQDFCDSAQNLYPDITERCSIQHGEAAMNEFEG